MLSWRAAADGRDRQGRSLFREAVALSHDLRLHHRPGHSTNDAYADMSPPRKRIQQGRNVTAWAMSNWSVYVILQPDRVVVHLGQRSDSSQYSQHNCHETTCPPENFSRTDISKH